MALTSYNKLIADILYAQKCCMFKKIMKNGISISTTLRAKPMNLKTKQLSSTKKKLE